MSDKGDGTKGKSGMPEGVKDGLLVFLGWLIGRNGIDGRPQKRGCLGTILHWVCVLVVIGLLIYAVAAALYIAACVGLWFLIRSIWRSEVASKPESSMVQRGMRMTPTVRKVLAGVASVAIVTVIFGIGSTSVKSQQRADALADAKVVVAKDAGDRIKADGDSFVVEYGHGTVQATSLLGSSDSDVTLSSDATIDLAKLGTQDIACTLSNDSGSRDVTATITVEDTQGPTISVKQETVQITQGDSFDPSSNITVTDPAEGSLELVTDLPESTGTADGRPIYASGWYRLSFTGPDGSSVPSVDTGTTGSYTVKVDACDCSGHEASDSYLVIVSVAQTTEESTSATGDASGTSSSETSTSEPTTTSTQTEEQAQDFVLNTSKRTIHRPGCQYVSKIKDSNKQTVHDTLSNLEAQGYTPCKKCLG